MREKVVKTGFLMPASYSKRAQNIAAAKGMSMRSLLVEAIGLGLQSLEDSMQPVSKTESTNLPDFASGTVNAGDVSELIMNLTEIAKLTPSAPTEIKTAPPRHKPTKPAASTWRFR